LWNTLLSEAPGVLTVHAQTILVKKMKLPTQLSALALLSLGLFTLTGCTSTELKDGTDDVVDVMRNGVGVITDVGNKTADAVKSASDKKD